jgi:hypothetical protein
MCGRNSKKRTASFRTATHSLLPEPSGHAARMTNRMLNCIRFTCVFLLFLMISHSAEAADHGQLGRTSPEIKAWANSLDNTLGEGCCSTADGWKPEEVEYDIKDNKYRVKIDGEWYDVPSYAVIQLPNKFGFPVVWYFRTWLNGIRPSILIRCFIPGAGG